MGQTSLHPSGIDPVKTRTQWPGRTWIGWLGGSGRELDWPDALTEVQA